MSVKIPDFKQMMAAGVHFGHKTSKWNPKMGKYIYGVKNGIHIFDLEKTKQTLETALQAVEDTVAKGGVVLFLGTKKQARTIIKKYAEEVGAPYVIERWIGGTITNFPEINKLVKKLKSLEEQAQADDYEAKYTKRERALFAEEIENLEKQVGGIRELKAVPDLIYIAGVKEEKTAVKEAASKRIKSVGIVDTNADPDKVTYPIAANDDAIKSIEMITALVAEAVKNGRSKQATVKANEKNKEEKEESKRGKAEETSGKEKEKPAADRTKTDEKNN